MVLTKWSPEHRHYRVKFNDEWINDAAVVDTRTGMVLRQKGFIHRTYHEEYGHVQVFKGEELVDEGRSAYEFPALTEPQPHIWKAAYSLESAGQETGFTSLADGLWDQAADRESLILNITAVSGNSDSGVGQEVKVDATEWEPINPPGMTMKSILEAVKENAERLKSNRPLSMLWFPAPFLVSLHAVEMRSNDLSCEDIERIEWKNYLRPGINNRSVYAEIERFVEADFPHEGWNVPDGQADIIFRREIDSHGNHYCKVRWLGPIDGELHIGKAVNGIVCISPRELANLPWPLEKVREEGDKTIYRRKDAPEAQPLTPEPGALIDLVTQGTALFFNVSWEDLPGYDGQWQTPLVATKPESAKILMARFPRSGYYSSRAWDEVRRLVDG